MEEGWKRIGSGAGSGVDRGLKGDGFGRGRPFLAWLIWTLLCLYNFLKLVLESIPVSNRRVPCHALLKELLNCNKQNRQKTVEFGNCRKARSVEKTVAEKSLERQGHRKSPFPVSHKEFCRNKIIYPLLHIGR